MSWTSSRAGAARISVSDGARALALTPRIAGLGQRKLEVLQGHRPRRLEERRPGTFDGFSPEVSGVALELRPGRLLGHGVELVADAVASLDEGVARRAAVDLLPHLADEDVDRSVAVRLAPAPHALEELVARDDPAALQRERIQEPELRRRQAGGVTVEVRLDLVRVDAELLDLDRLAARRLLRPHPPPRRGLHARDKLLHGERLHEVVVGPHLERVDPVVLGAPSADADDRCADAVAARS